MVALTSDESPEMSLEIKKLPFDMHCSKMTVDIVANILSQLKARSTRSVESKVRFKKYQSESFLSHDSLNDEIHKSSLNFAFSKSLDNSDVDEMIKLCA